MRARERSRLEMYWPYPKQSKFHQMGSVKRERALLAANQSGKTLCAGAEIAMHLSGRYPEWWKGLRFKRANNWLAGSESGELTRRGVQRILCGRDIKTALGTGMIPGDQIVRAIPGRGVPDLLDTVMVKHISGGVSSVGFKSYDQGREKWQADTVDGVWFDEEPPEDIYTEGLTRTNTTMGPVILTATPLKGMTEVIARYMVQKVDGTCFVMMSLDEADHYTDEQRAAIVKSYPAHERDARTKGVPILGSGRVFPIEEDAIKCEAFAIPAHWSRLCATDFGWDHPLAFVWLAWDRDNDIVYVYHCVRQKNATPVIMAPTVNAQGRWIPISWPADGLQTEKGSGFQLAQQYRDAGMNMRAEHAKFEETHDEQETNTSLVSVEAGIMVMLERMQSGRFKVFSHLHDWFEEFRLYHRKDGKIVKLIDDLMSASRYGIMDLRHAITQPVQTMRRRPPPNWKA